MKALILIMAILFVSAACLVKQTPEVIPPEEQEEQQDNMYMVSHSEYWSNEEGQIITRLLNFRGIPIPANCTVDILYPNKSFFVQNQTMTFNVDSYYYSFITPTTVGVYEYKATCVYDGKSRSVMNSFHLSPALNFINISYEDTTARFINLTNLNKAHFGNLTVNLTQIKEDTDYIRANLQTNASTDSILDQLDSILNFCDTNATDTSNLCLWVNQTKNRLIAMNNTVETYLIGINDTVDTSADVIVTINQTVANISQFTIQDRFMLEKIYNCTILGEGCYLTPETIWNYTARYIHGEVLD